MEGFRLKSKIQQSFEIVEELIQFASSDSEIKLDSHDHQTIRKILEEINFEDGKVKKKKKVPTFFQLFE